MNDSIIVPRKNPPPAIVAKKLDDFLKTFRPHELNSGKLHLFLDEKSDAYYLACHLEGRILSGTCDTEASLDGDDEEIYKLNRDVREDEAAYQLMEKDALKGRSFEDIVLEFDTSYRPKKPLKVYGGQHRLRAITGAQEPKGTTLHGVRVYFALTREQKVEIATINNTAIAVPNDLLDRMREQLLGTELRDWCQKVGLLEEKTDFAPRRSPDRPTVRLARTLIVNFYLGIESLNLEDLHQPILCKSGDTMDSDYVRVRNKIDWSNVELTTMGIEFSRLHRMQMDTVSNREEDSNAEFARKALSLSVVASWSYAAGLFQKNPIYLKNLYSLPDNVAPPDDPLNAKALSQARLKPTDPDTYRGLGTRSGAKELSRMLEVFLVLAIKDKKRITEKLANFAIRSAETKKAVHETNKASEKI